MVQISKITAQGDWVVCSRLPIYIAELEFERRI